MNSIGRIALMGAFIYLIAMVFSGISVTGVFAAVMVALVLSIINNTIKPILQFISLPITVLSLGLFSIVLNALLILLVDWFLPGFDVAGFWSAALFSIALSAINMVLPSHAKMLTKKERNPSPIGYQTRVNQEKVIDVPYEVVED